MRRQFLLMVPLFLVLWLGCGGSGSGGSTTGIRGTTIREVVGGAVVTPPSDSPLAGAVVTIQPGGGGAEIARTMSDAQGNFAIFLPAGVYLVIPLLTSNLQGGLNVSSQTVTVASGAMTTIQIKYILDAP